MTTWPATGLARAHGVVNAALGLVLLACAALVLAGWPGALWFQSFGVSRALTWTECLAFMLGGAVVVAALRPLGAGVMAAFVRLAARLATRPAIPVVLGVGVRVLIALLVEPVASSDGATYLGLASRLASGLPYMAGDTHAYWPPGFAFALMPVIHLFGTGLAGLLLAGLLSYLAASAGAWCLARKVGLGAWAPVPLWLLAFWPTHVLCAGLPEKELLVAALVPWVLFFGMGALKGRFSDALWAGFLLGAAVLVQPSLQLLPLLALVLALVGLPHRMKTLSLFIVMALAMMAVVGPWTYRNQLVLGAPVLVSTNGGSNLYRANNELATGGYVEKGLVDVDSLGELDSNREGKRLAMEWIGAHLPRFAQLSAGKSLLFSGDDSYGAYAALRRGAEARGIDRWSYLGIKLLAAAPWLLVWVVIAAAVHSHRRLRRALPMPVVPLMLPYAYLLAIHSVFESGGKYHIPTLIPVLMLAVLLAKSLADARSARGDIR